MASSKFHFSVRDDLNIYIFINRKILFLNEVFFLVGMHPHRVHYEAGIDKRLCTQGGCSFPFGRRSALREMCPGNVAFPVMYQNQGQSR